MASQTVLGAVVGKALGSYDKKAKVPELPKVDLSQEQKLAISDNQAALPGAEKLASSVNAFNSAELNKLMSQAFPFFNQMLGKASANANSLLAGELPADVSRSVSQSAAAKALAGGYGGTGMGRALEARDIGRTSLSLQQQGLSNFGALSQAVQPVLPRPFDVTSMFMNPLQRATWTNEQNLQQFQRNWMQNQLDAQADPWKKALGEGFNNLFSTAASIGTMGLGSGGFGGMFGGGGSAQPSASASGRSANDFWNFGG